MNERPHACGATSYEEEFLREGYVVVKGLLTKEACQRARATILETFHELDASLPGRTVRFLTPSVAFTLPEVWAYPVHERVVEVLKAILEPGYTLVPDLQVQRNLYGLNRLSIARIPLPNRWGWHQDAGSEGFKPIHVDPRYRFVKCGLYLQDNDPHYGGGIDIVPRSHRFPLRTGDAHRDWQIRQFVGRLRIAFNVKTVPLEAGDAVFFHSFLWHSSTIPLQCRAYLTEEDRRLDRCRVPAEKTKLTVYFNACRSLCADHFMRNSLERARTELRAATTNPHGADLFFCDYLTLQATERLPDEFLQQARRQGIQLAALAGAELEEALQLRRAMLAEGRLTNVVQTAMAGV